MSKNQRFKVIFEQEQDGGYAVHVPALSGCASQGETLDEAMTNVQEAIKLYLWSLKDDGLPVPQADLDIQIKDIEVMA